MTSFLTTAQVAEHIGYPSAESFLVKRARLERDHGFPEPMPAIFRPLRWRADQVDAWLARQGTPRAEPDDRPTGPNVVLFELARSA
jgi:hypothetical protein